MGIDIQKIKAEKPIEELIKFSLINIDKPAGPTSFSISDYIRKSLNLNKTSHAGTLDPQVTGVLPIMLGRACRLSDYFMHRNKTYVGIMRLHKDISDETLKAEIKKFIGKIKQLPPVKSRVKRELREREIISFEILEREDKDVLFKAEVQAGTYIRKLCDDIGKKIGRAHMLELRRIKAGIFSEDSKEFPIINLYDFDKAVEEYRKGNESMLRKILIPAEIISRVLPVVQAKKEAVEKLLKGKPIMKNDLVAEIPAGADNFAVFFGDRFIEVARVVDEKNIIARPDFVFN